MTDDRHLLEALGQRVAVNEPMLASAAIVISRIPYGRPSIASPQAVIAEWRGTCTTKHVLFAGVAAELDVGAAVRLVHRVYRVSRDDAAARWGTAVASTVPDEGLVDVHTYANLHRTDRVVTVDVTFPLKNWDGNTPLPLACGRGEDVDAGEDPLATKAELVRTWCDPDVREGFIAALTRYSEVSS